MDEKELVKKALQAREASYAPYSKFRVGACLLAKNGKTFSGCNIENASFPATNCAERTAFFKAVSEGEREFQSIAIVGGEEQIEDFCPPCGICLQVMMEFCNPETFEIILGRMDLQYEKYVLKDLLPKGFGPGNMQETV